MVLKNAFFRFLGVFAHFWMGGIPRGGSPDRGDLGGDPRGGSPRVQFEQKRGFWPKKSKNCKNYSNFRKFYENLLIFAIFVVFWPTELDWGDPIEFWVRITPISVNFLNFLIIIYNNRWDIEDYNFKIDTNL